ncbi:MAG: hypothetical protein RBT78_06475, partial [Kiritimatiellia bacterium]|nr:hypothetical protein [Kiritimatiellia bacterium]
SGGLTEADRARLRMGRQALHAARLAFRHPRFGTPTEVIAPIPPDMAVLTGGARVRLSAPEGGFGKEELGVETP